MKYLIVIYGVSILAYCSHLRIKNKDIELQKKLLFLILALILTPLIVALLKHYSPITCPAHIKEFGGNSVHISPLEIFKKDIFLVQFGKCFPAGHASGGFALISLYFVIPDPKLKRCSLLFALTLGSIMGLYQITKGVHYLSDTIVTLSIAYLVSITLHKFILEKA